MSIAVITFSVGALAVIGTARLALRRLERAEEADAAFDLRMAEARAEIAKVREQVRAGVRPHGNRFTLHRVSPTTGKETYVSSPAERSANGE